MISLKLAYFAIERLAEPISQRLETYAAQSPSFRAACWSIATWSSRLEHNKKVRRSLWLQAKQARLLDDASREDAPGHMPQVSLADLDDDLNPAPPELDEKEATQQGCELLGEGFVLGVGLALLLHQVAQDRADEAANEAKVEANEARVTALERQQKELCDRIVALDGELRSSREEVLQLRSAARCPPTASTEDSHGADGASVLNRYFWRRRS